MNRQLNKSRLLHDPRAKYYTVYDIIHFSLSNALLLLHLLIINSLSFDIWVSNVCPEKKNAHMLQITCRSLAIELKILKLRNSLALVG